LILEGPGRAGRAGGADEAFGVLLAGGGQDVGSCGLDSYRVAV
jgi:hypothetical protein